MHHGSVKSILAKKSMYIPQGFSEAINRRRTENTMTDMYILCSRESSESDTFTSIMQRCRFIRS